MSRFTRLLTQDDECGASHWALGLALAALCSCGRTAPDTSAIAAKLPLRSDASSVLKPAQRTSSAASVHLRQAIDRGHVDDVEASTVLADLSIPHSERELMRARIAALGGRDTEAMRSIEDARKLTPDDPCVYAAAAEIYSALGKPSLAWGEIVRGEKQCGASSELARARGILEISRQGRAAKGLELLEQALAADPTIPFIDRALGQAHLLVAKEQAKANDVNGALEHVRASLRFDPTEVDARRLQAELMTAAHDYKGAIAALEALIADGEPLEAELALTFKNAGFAALLRDDHEEALDDFIEARKRGLTAEELSFAATKLATEAQRTLERGVDCYKKQDLECAEQSFRRALACDPDLIQAENHLAIVVFKKRQYSEAVRLWQRVIATARAEKIELPEPVHLNLAKAQVQEGDREGAALTLEEYLDRQPSGEWAAPTRAMLASLPPATSPR